MRMNAEIMSTGKTAAGIVIPDDVVAALGPSRHPAVKVTIGSYVYRSSIARMGGAFMLPVTAETRAGAGVAAGDRVELDIELDVAPREVAMPRELVSALDGDPIAKGRFEALSYTNKRRLVIQIDLAKGESTRQRRVQQAVAKLHEE
jgi:hypothetical protein